MLPVIWSCNEPWWWTVARLPLTPWVLAASLTVAYWAGRRGARWAATLKVLSRGLVVIFLAGVVTTGIAAAVVRFGWRGDPSTAIRIGQWFWVPCAWVWLVAATWRALFGSRAQARQSSAVAPSSPLPWLAAPGVLGLLIAWPTEHDNYNLPGFLTRQAWDYGFPHCTKADA